MKALNIISAIIVSTVIAISSAQAGNMTTDELFDFLQAGDENSIQSVEKVEFSKLEFTDINTESRKTYMHSISDVFNTINSD